MPEDILVTTHVHGCMQNFTRILPRNPSPMLWIKFFATECLKILEHKIEGCRPVPLQSDYRCPALESDYFHAQCVVRVSNDGPLLT